MLIDEAATEEYISAAGEVAGNKDRKLKERLLRKYGGHGHISSLKQEFSKTKKKENLPKEAKRTLLNWWNIHSQWPYPTAPMIYEGHQIPSLASLI
ncbi:homeobox protein knotted-1-like 2 isoform X3 [Cucumis melo var. makuwa]|uniref:Homeobox protein knotted-1-like 2 isoform X3 n=1 Tax=Cucumis melo var. makuwa TaxID=1194695 RepID=A0A5A7UT33_CUCMM|nr:homeobox protein knotted-1-like 2 isoform X3 [Cucumis melo var. makuwa]TYJ98557.1 homeobox protein knotted-1-like 2 isoform X3 [Cucumis melo var. makuwa]